MPSLKVVTGPNPEEVFPIRNGDTLGRDPTNEIPIPAPGVSRKHVQFSIERNEVWIQDLGSVNGTYVNGVKIDKQKLKDGDAISLSEITFKYRQADAAP